MRRIFTDRITGEEVKTTDLTGHVFNKLTAVQFDHMRRSKHGSKAYWNFMCECGNEGVKFSQLAKRGRIKSCGCSCNVYTGTLTEQFNLHDKDMKRTRQSWYSMRRRCSNPKSDSYYNYGAKGIKVCDEWEDFGKFLEDMGVRPPETTLDRKCVYGNYEKSNCRWSSTSVQANNKSVTRYVTYQGEKMSLKNCVEKHSMNRYDTVWNRLRSGWDLHLALKLKPDHANLFISKCVESMDDDELSMYMNK